MAHDAMSDIVTIRIDRFAHWMPQLVRAVAILGDVTPEALAGPSRSKWLVTLRQATALAAHDVLKKSYPQIACDLGGRDHSTIFAAHRRAVTRRKTDGEFLQLSDVALGIARAIAGRELPGPGIEPELPL